MIITIIVIIIVISFVLLLLVVVSALNALKFQCVQRNSLSKLFIEEKMPYNQCQGKSLRDSDKL